VLKHKGKKDLKRDGKKVRCLTSPVQKKAGGTFVLLEEKGEEGLGEVDPGSKPIVKGRGSGASIANCPGSL